MAATIQFHHRHLSLLLSPIADTHFTVPQRVEGWVDLGNAGRMRSPCPRLYIAMAVVIKHNWPWPLTLQSIMPLLNDCDLLRHVGVNNLPKVVTWQRRGWELNSQPVSCRSNALATRLLNHPKKKLVSWSLTSLFSTNMAISEMKGQGWKVIHTQWRKASDILTSTLVAFLFSSHPKKGKGSRGSFKLLH